jgi:N-acyl-D-aspartate/D-glutamate deacylase
MEPERLFLQQGDLMRRLAAFALGLLLAGAALLPSAAKPPAAGEPYDLVIRHGKIVDGTGNPWFPGDVAVRGRKIVALGKIPAAASRREIDARGLVVAPGFIDIHSHSDFTLLEDGDAQSKIRQGVTTEVLGEDSSPGPYQGKLKPRRLTVRGQPERWTTLGGYFDLVERAGVSPNVASFVGLGTVWECVMGKSHQRPTPAQLDQMKALVEQAMKDGAAGLSCMLAMPPGALATTDDIVELCKVVARYGGIFVTHIRHEGTGVFAAIREAIEIGRRAGITVEILHIKIADQAFWGRMGEVVKLIDAARKGGVNVGADVYPYTRGNNNLASIIPPWAHEGGTAKMLARLKNPADRARLKKDIREGIPGWYNHYTAVGGDWGRMLISARGSYQGLTMDRILAARTRGKKPAPDMLDELFDLLIEEGGSVSTVYDHHSEKDMNLALAQPWCSVGSDGVALATEGPLRRGHPHPRSFGTFPRVLGVYVRQKGLLRLEEAVRKMTSQNAVKIGAYDRGLLRPGNYADLTLFDPERVIDRSTYTDPFRYSEGIEYVIVNGQVVLDRGRHTGARPGQALRRNR